MLTKLSTREKRFIALAMWLEGSNCREIGDRLNLSRERARQLLAAAMEEVRQKNKKFYEPETTSQE